MSFIAALALAASTSTATLPTCSWDRPGVNPFTGDLIAAVDRYKDIPQATRAKLKARMGKREYDEIALITRGAILGKSTYSADIRDMHFGTGKVCQTVSRKKWSDTHQERGLVYCEDGHCLIVPTVCRNLSRIVRSKLDPIAGSAEEESMVLMAELEGDAPLEFEAPGAGGDEPFEGASFDRLATPADTELPPHARPGVYTGGPGFQGPSFAQLSNENTPLPGLPAAWPSLDPLPAGSPAKTGTQGPPDGTVTPPTGTPPTGTPPTDTPPTGTPPTGTPPTGTPPTGTPPTGTPPTGTPPTGTPPTGTPPTGTPPTGTPPTGTPPTGTPPGPGPVPPTPVPPPTLTPEPPFTPPPGGTPPGPGPEFFPNPPPPPPGPTPPEGPDPDPFPKPPGEELPPPPPPPPFDPKDPPPPTEQPLPTPPGGPTGGGNVPEPGSLLLGLMGLAALGLRRKR